MPQYPVTVYDADGAPTVMHSVDAKEAVTFGDYTYAAPSDKPDPEAMAAARARFQTGEPTTHPELLSDEAKDKQRAEANEKAALLAAIPEGAQVVVMAPQPTRAAEAPRRPQGAQRPATGSSEGSTTTPATPVPEQQRAARRESGSSTG